MNLIWTILGSGLLIAVPLVLASIGETIGQRSGLINIGLEGMINAGAFGALTATLATHRPEIGLLAGALSGLLVGLIQSVFVIRWQRNQVVVGVAVNLLVTGVTNALFRERFGASGALLSVETLPKWAGIDALVIGTLILIVVADRVLKVSAWGLAIRATGEAPHAVKTLGLPVRRLRWQAASIAALLGGLAGAYLVVGLAGTYNESMAGGKGFMAIAMVVFGRWKIPWVLAACAFISCAESATYALQAAGAVAVPHQLLVSLPYVLSLAVLAFGATTMDAPASLGTSEA